MSQLRSYFYYIMIIKRSAALQRQHNRYV